MIETISRQHVTSQPERVSANTETISHRGPMAVGDNTKNKHNMKMKLENNIEELMSKYCQEIVRPKGIADVIQLLGRVPPSHDSGNQSEAVAASRVLEACALTEVFSMLCDRPCGGIASLRVLLVPGCGVPLADLLPPREPYTLQDIDPTKCGVIFDVKAEFGRLISESEVHFEDYHGEDRAELLNSWHDRHDKDSYLPERILAASPHPLSARVLLVFSGDGVATIPSEDLDYEGPLAILRNKRTVRQWLERFEEDRWYENDLAASLRLQDHHDWRAWVSVVGEGR